MAQKKQSWVKKKRHRDAVLFGIVLSELRRQQGFTQQALAEASGYTSNYISLLECGESNPTLSGVLRLASSLKVKASEMIQRLEALQGH